MNIFYLHSIPAMSARMHNDVHVKKMAVETAQILSTAHRVLDGDMVIRPSKTGKTKRKYYDLKNEKMNDVLYLNTHENNGVVKWARESIDNYEWTYELFKHLCNEYKFRFGKDIASSKLIPLLKRPPKNLTKKGFTEPVTAVGDVAFVVKGSPVETYRRYYKIEKRKYNTYTKREKPAFLLN